METQVKTTKPDFELQVIHKVPAGTMPEDNDIELFADRLSRRLFFISAGKTRPFHELPNRIKSNIFKMLRSDRVAWDQLKHMKFDDGLERYAYCMFGAIDSEPDFHKDGSLGSADNFQCGIANCNCKNWERKQFMYRGQVIKGRVLDVLMAFRSGADDRNVASNLGIELSTLYAHKKRLFNIFDVYSKTEMVLAAIEAKIYQ